MKHQKLHSSGWGQRDNATAKIKVKVPAVEELRAYVRSNVAAQMHLQAGLDAIPETVEQFHEDDEYGLVSVKPRPGICYGYHWEQLMDVFASICQTPPRYENADLIGIPFSSIVLDLSNNEYGRVFFSTR